MEFPSQICDVKIITVISVGIYSEPCPFLQKCSTDVMHREIPTLTIQQEPRVRKDEHPN